MNGLELIGSQANGFASPGKSSAAAPNFSGLMRYICIVISIIHKRLREVVKIGIMGRVPTVEFLL